MNYIKYNVPMGKQYENTMLENLQSLQVDLQKNNITQEEFQFLLGLLLETEVDSFVQHKLDNFLRESDTSSISLLKYERTFSHA